MQFPCQRPRGSRSPAATVVARRECEINSGVDVERTSVAAGEPARAAVVVELLVIAAFAAVFLIAFQARPGYVDLLLAMTAVAFIALGYKRSRRLWEAQPTDHSSRRQRLAASSRGTAVFTLSAALVLLGVGFVSGYTAGGLSAAAGRIANWHLAAAVLLYLPWAWLQQFVFQFYLLGRLLYLLPLPAAVALTAAAFSMVHFPRAPVMAATLVAGAVWALLYRRYRTLVPLAVSHAVLGAALHYWAFGRDLLASWLGTA